MKEEKAEVMAAQAMTKYYPVHLKNLIYTITETKAIAIRGDSLDRIYTHLTGLEHELLRLKDLNVPLKRDWWEFYDGETEIPGLVFEILDAFIDGMEDEKGIAPDDEEFQERMDHSIRTLKDLKKELMDPTEFIRLKNTGLTKVGDS